MTNKSVDTQIRILLKAKKCQVVLKITVDLTV